MTVTGSDLPTKAVGRKFKTARKAVVPQTPKVDVYVDEKTINEAVVRNSSHCMIAEAVKKALPYARGVLVDLQSIRLTDADRGLRYTYLTPRGAQLALIAFDQGEKPKPFRMHLAKGSVRRAQHKAASKKDWDVPLADRLRIISALQDARSKRKATLEQIGDATDIAPRSVERYVSADPPVFSRMVAEKLDAWAAGRAIPHKRPNAVAPSLVSGRARLREQHDRSAPEVVGGKSPPIGNLAKRRGFGLHSMVL